MLQNHFDIVQPTVDVARRFGLPVKKNIPEVDIWDRSDLQGIVAIAYESVLERLIEVLRRRLGDVITRTPKVAKSSIYRGVVVGRDDKTGHTRINLGKASGLLPDKKLKRGTPIMVQVRAHDYGRKAPVLSTNITVPGRAVVLLPEPVVRISTKIKEPEKRRWLIQLGRDIQEHTDNWGILWRTAAEKLTEKELREETDDLLDAAQQMHTKYSELDETGILFEGTSNADIEFSSEVKEALDKTRAKIKPTVTRHHFYKSAGYAPLVDLSELIIEERPEERKYITAKLEQVISSNAPKENDPINIEHVKLDGRNIILSRGRVIEVNPKGLVLRRQFRHTTRKLKMSRDHPDGAKVPRDEGDYAITYVVLGSRLLVTKYYSRKGDLKGTYVNINTGVELYPANNGPSRVRYIDLEVDVIQQTNGDVRIVDQHLLKRALHRGFLTKDIAERTLKKADSVYQDLIEGRI